LVIHNLTVSTRSSQNWLLLIPQLPAKPAYLRVKIWRRLQAMGAVPLKNAVHALPNRAELRSQFDELHGEIIASGGEALLLEATLCVGLSDADLQGMFDAARDADYEDVAREASVLAESDFVPEIEVRRLRKRMDEIGRIDFFGAHGKQAAEAAINRAKGRMGQHPDVSGPGVNIPLPEELRDRVWVTRKHVHVDRIASAWLIRRFIDAEATFKFVDGKDYVAEANELRFDMAGAEFTHEEDRCSFETLVLRTGLDDPALGVIGEMIHELDIADGKYEQPETAGLGAMLGGICASIEDDLERIASGSQALDQLHAYLANRKPAK
jgi:hypothetical protein